MILTKKSFKSQEKQEELEKEAEWSKMIRERDGWACCFCGSPNKTNAHHLVVREFKPLKYDLDNGLTLCTFHHKFSRMLSAHNNPFVFFMWLEKYRPEQISRLKQKVRDLYAQQEGILL